MTGFFKLSAGDNCPIEKEEEEDEAYCIEKWLNANRGNTGQIHLA